MSSSESQSSTLSGVEGHLKQADNQGLPNGWKECRLGDVVDVIGGGTPKTSVAEYWNGNIPWLSVVDFNTGKKYVSLTEKTITNLGLEKSSTKLLNKNDIIISARGTVGALAMLDKPMTFNQSCYGVRAKEDISINDYIFYLLKDTVKQLQQVSYGAVFDTITRNTFDETGISLPPLQEQKAIAEVLSSLDDKIDLLHQQNQTLEDMAQTLFREWFVEKADEGWEEVKLGDYINCHNGFSYKSSDLSESKNALVTLKNFARDGTLRLDGFKEFTSIKYKDSQIVRDGDLVVSHTDITQEADIIGNPIIIQNIHNYNTLVITMDLVKVESKFDWLSKNYLYCLFKSSDFKFHCLCNSNGSTVLHMSKKALPEYIFKLPSIDTLKRFTLVVDDIFRKKIMNQKQIKSLEQTRDTLLTKLMSGEVRV